MPLGENVGTAYVRLFIDGTGIDEQIRDEFEKAEPEYRKSAKKNAKNYDQEFADYLDEKGVAGNAMRDSLTKGLKEADFTKDFFDGPKWEAQKKRIAKNFAELAPVMIKDLENEFNKRGSLDGLSDALSNLNPRADEARRSLVRLAKAEQLIIDNDLAEMLRLQAKRLKEIDAGIADSTEHLLTERSKDFKDIIHRIQATSAEMDEFEKDWRRTTDAISKDADKNFREANQAIDDHGRAVARTEAAYRSFGNGLRTFFRDVRRLQPELDDNDRALIRVRRGFDKTTEGIHHFADGMGAAFGRGSRNNFFHFTGSLVRGMFNLTSVFSQLGSSITKIPELFGKVFGNMDEFGKVTYNLSSVSQGLVLSLGALGAAGAVGAVGLSVLAAAISPLIGLASGLLAIVTALVSTIGFALVGAVGALVTALLPLALGIGAVVAGIISLSDEQKKLVKESIKPLTDAFKDLGDIAADTLTHRVGDMAKKVAPVIESLEPLARRISDAVADIGDSWAESVNSPAFARFVTVMQRHLPDMLRTLGDIIENTLGGVGGLFEGMIPIAERFLGWLAGITQTFSDWANSAGGQSQIVAFFERAGDSASAFGGFLGNVWDLISTILAAGQDTGDSIFTRMGEAIGGWADYLKKNPDALGDWFRNAEDTAGDLGKLIDDIGSLLDKLDSDEARTAGNNLLTIVGAISRLAELLVSTGDDNFVLQILNGDWAGAAKALGKNVTFTYRMLYRVGKFAGEKLIEGITSVVETLWPKITAAFDTAVSAIGDVFSKVPGLISSALSGIGGFFTSIWSSVTTTAQSVVNSVVGFFQALPGRIVGVIQRLPGMFTRVLDRILFAVGFMLGRIVRFFIRLPGQVRSAISALPSRIAGIWNRVESGAQSMLTRIVGFFKSLPGRAAGAALGLVAQVAGLFVRVKDRVRGYIDDIVGFFRKLPSRILGALSSLVSTLSGPFDRLVTAVEKIPGQIVDAFTGLGSDILGAIGSIDIGSLIKWPGGRVGSLAKGFVEGVTASGGIFGAGMAGGGLITTGPSFRLIGEAGPEAVVPLHRELARVDPSVRALSAFAQGKGQVTSGPSKTIDVGGITINTPTKDPAAVAQEVVNRLVATGY